MSHKDFYRVAVRKQVKFLSWSSLSPSQSSPLVLEESPIHTGSDACFRLKGPGEGCTVALELFAESVRLKGRES